MRICNKPIALAGVAGLLAAGLMSSAAQAQGPARVGNPLPGVTPFFRVGPNLTLAQAAFNTATMGQAASFVPPYALGFNPYISSVFPPSPVGGIGGGYGGLANPYGAASFTSNAYGGGGNDPYSGYGGYSYYGESVPGGYLRGAADVINAQGRFLESVQKRDLMREQVYKERLENKKRALDTYLYLRAHTPTYEDDRQAYFRQVLRRSVNDPTAPEIWSGQPLNAILDDLAKNKDRSTKGPSVNLDEDLLRHLNFAPGGSDINVGFLRRVSENEGRIPWPIALKDNEFKSDRELLNALTPDALRQVLDGKLDAGTYKDISSAVERMQQQLAGNIQDLPGGQYREARRFLNNFADALRALRQPNASDYFSQKYMPKGKTVSDLVKFMLEKGLKFAPATQEDQPYYVALQRALAEYHGGVQSQMAADRPQ
jgi:hypothetical protein